MKTSGFTLVRNGVAFDYPFEESIRSLAAVVDEVVVNVGKSTDETYDRVKKISEELGSHRFIIFESDWDLDNEEKKRGGKILSEQTNLALDRCSYDWCVYLQADEVLSEKDISSLKYKLDLANSNHEVDGLVFDYIHFYGSFDVVQESRSAYRREVRAIRKSSHARSIGDAQSFRKENNEKLRVISASAKVYHYGWVRVPEAMQEKTFFMDQLYHGKPSEQQQKTKTPHSGDNYKYKRIPGLKKFIGKHPRVMEDRIQKKNWSWDWKASPQVFSLGDAKKIALDLIESKTGYRLFEYKSYKWVKEPEPKASVMLSTFRMPKELGMVLESLSRQTFKNFEIILCEDDEHSETVAIVKEFLLAHPEVKLKHFTQKNIGFRKCRILNQGIVQATGQILIFLDGDCVVHPKFIEDHVFQYQTGFYLAGRRIDLEKELTQNLSTDSVKSGFFDGPNLGWLLARLKSQSDKLHRTVRVETPVLRELLKLNRVTDLKGCNFSVSKSDMIAINGFDETYEGYGREDTDVELRLQNLGLKIKSLRGLAIQYHLWHPRREFTANNESLLESVKNEKRVLAIKGLSHLRGAL